MSEITIATRLADWVTGLNYDAIPEPAIDAAKLLILDQLGLQINGATLPNIRPELQLVHDMAARPESTIVGFGEKTGAPYAAFLGGTLAGSRGHAPCPAQRRKAAATPASTGMCRPVVWDSSPPVSASTAAATCSGSTSRLSRVRWA